MPNHIGGRLGRNDFASEEPTNGARKVLADCGISLGADFFTLHSSQVSALLEHSVGRLYRKPKNANGSKGRYLHAKLQREASRVTLGDAKRSMRASSEDRKAEREFVKAFTPNKYGEYA